MDNSETRAALGTRYCSKFKKKNITKQTINELLHRIASTPKIPHNYYKNEWQHKIDSAVAGSMNGCS